MSTSTATRAPDHPALRLTRADLAAAWPGWAAARLLTGAALLATRLYLHAAREHDPLVLTRAHQGLMSWDGAWYRAIALHGYGGVPREGLRFFPLYPALSRLVALAAWPAGPYARSLAVTAGLLLLANGLALVAGALLHGLVEAHTGDTVLARRATWCLAVAPPAFVMVMAYSEALAIVLAIAAVACLRARRWWWAAAAGAAYGLTRPVGLLLVVPAAIEAVPVVLAVCRTRPVRAARLVGPAAAVAAPAAGTSAFLVYVWLRFGDARLPMRVQSAPHLRGPYADPVAVWGHSMWHLVTGDLGSQLHYPWVAAFGAVLVLGAHRLHRARRPGTGGWPAAWTAWAVVTYVSALSAYNLNSMERYLFGAFPVVAMAASLARSRRAARAGTVVLAALMAGYAAAAFSSQYVP